MLEPQLGFRLAQLFGGGEDNTQDPQEAWSCIRFAPELGQVSVKPRESDLSIPKHSNLAAPVFGRAFLAVEGLCQNRTAPESTLCGSFKTCRVEAVAGAVAVVVAVVVALLFFPPAQQ